ncbi:MAG: alpha-E domain-containing protein [Gemmataceae bacterium]
MLSRVAENLFWIARYVERAECLARLLDDAFHRELDAGPVSAIPLRPLEEIVTILAGGAAMPATRERDELLEFLAFERGGAASIRGMIAAARENARGIQDALNSEAWSQLNRCYLWLSGERAKRLFAASPSRYFERVKRECVLFVGLAFGGMTRAEAYHFLQVGRYLERIDMLSRMLAVRFGSAGESAASPLAWAGLLRSCSAYEAYCKVCPEALAPPDVLRFLLLEHDFPRSMHFGVRRCLESLRVIGGEDGPAHEAERLLGRLDGDLRYADVAELFQRGVSDFLAGVQQTCGRVGHELHQTYFLG